MLLTTDGFLLKGSFPLKNHLFGKLSFAYRIMDLLAKLVLSPGLHSASFCRMILSGKLKAKNCLKCHLSLELILFGCFRKAIPKYCGMF